jgi:SOS response regulatory protein OraA/RecX
MEEHVKLTFKEQWEQRKLLKRSKKKAKKELMKKGFDASSASSMVKKALSNIVNKPERKAAGRGK